MIRRRHAFCPQPTFPLAPMVDVVFLLLIYFMTTSSLHREEADLAMTLPGNVSPENPLSMPLEALVELDSEGRPSLNGRIFDEPNAPRYTELAAALRQLAASARTTDVPPRVLLRPSPKTPHQAIVRTLDAAASAQIKDVYFVDE